MIVKFKYVNPPKEGKTFGNLKGYKDGESYAYMPGPVDLKPDVDYDIEIKNTKWGENAVKIIASVNGEAFTTEAKKGGAGGGGGKPTGNPKMDFAGRVVAAGIIAGKILTPDDMKKWASKAFAIAGELS